MRVFRLFYCCLFFLLRASLFAQEEHSVLNMAYKYYAVGNYDSALVKAMHSRKYSNPSLINGRTDLLIGKILRKMGMLDSASYYLLSSRSLGRKNNVDSILIQANIELGSVYGMLERLELSEEHFEESRAKAISNQDTLSWSRSLMGLGTLAYLQDKNEEALEMFQKAISIFRSKNKLDQLSSTLLNVSDLYRKLNRFDEALKAIDEAIDTFLDLKDSLGVSHAYHNKGLILFDVDQYSQALNAYRLSLDMANQAESKLDIEKAWFGMSMSYGGLGDYEQAFSYLNQYLESHDEPNYEGIENTYNIRLDDTVRFWQDRLDINNVELLNTKIVGVAIVALLVMMIVLIRLRQRQKLTLIFKNQEISNQKIDDLLQQQEINSLQGVLAGQEGERQRIATDLHDKLGAILGMVKLHFSAVEDRIDDLRDDNKKQYDKANELLDQASIEVRNISHNLLSGVLVKFGLVPALQDLKDTVEATGKLKVQFIPGDQMEVRLSGEQELQMYRIVQELISNILKHAKATEAVIQLNRTNGEINLIVEDNGVGFDVESARQKEGIGLKNLEARAAKLNAKLHFDSGKGGGTTVSIDIPLKEGNL